MDIKHIKKLYEIIEKNTSANKIEVSYKNFKAKIVRSEQQSVPVPAVSNISKLTNKEEQKQIADSKKRILSKNVGFFTRFDPKTKKHCKKIGDKIKKGEIVAYIIAMHVSIPVLSDYGGKIVNFLVEEKQPVEYKQPIVNLE